MNEGHNSLIKAMSDRCKNITLPLLSGRVNLKRELGVGMRGANTRWSAIRPHAKAILEESFTCSDVVPGILADDKRFEPPCPVPSALPGSVVAQQYPRLVPGKLAKHVLEWCSAKTLQLHRLYPDIDATNGLLFGKYPRQLRSGDTLHIIVDKAHSLASLMALDVQPDDDDGPSAIQI